MDCRITNHYMEDYLDDMLDDATRGRFQEHVERCPDCRNRLARGRELKNALNALPEPILDPDFAARAFKHAAAAHTWRRRIDTSKMMRIAASILVIVALGIVLKGGWGPGQLESPKAFVQLNQPEDVQLVFYSEENLENVTFRLEPPDGIELVGFENQREIVWQGNLARGDNLLVLPVIARNREGGSLVAEIRHGSRNKQFRLQLKVQQADHPHPGADRFDSSVAPMRFI